MFRFGVQGNAEDIKSMSAAAIRSVVARALKKNIIPSGTSVEETIKLLDSGANDLILNHPSGFSGKTLSNMLDLHGLNDNQKYAFARVFQGAASDPVPDVSLPDGEI